MASQEFKYPYLPGLLLGADPVNAGAAIAENVELPKLGELSKRPGFRRVNQRRYAGAIVCIPDLQRICDYRKLLVLIAFPDWPGGGGGIGLPAPIFEHEQPLPDGGGGGGDDPEPFFAPNYAPIAVASASVASGDIPLMVDFSSAGSYDPDGVIASYHWDFGDGSESAEENPSHIYTLGNTYVVTLTVTDNDGGTASDIVNIVAETVYSWVFDTGFGGPVTTWLPHAQMVMSHAGSLYAWRGFPVNDYRLMRRDGPDSWSALAVIPANRAPSQNTRPSLLSDGTDLYCAIRAIGPPFFAELYRLAGAAWVLVDTQGDFHYADEAGLYLLDSQLHWFSTPAMIPAPIKTRAQNPGWGDVNSTTAQTRDFSVVAVATTRTVVPTRTFYWAGGVFNSVANTNNPHALPQPAQWNGEHWGIDAVGLRHKLITNTAWITMAIPGGWVPLACSSDGTHLFIGAQRNVGGQTHSGILRYDGVEFIVELDEVVTSAWRWFTESTGGQMWALRDNGLYRRIP